MPNGEPFLGAEKHQPPLEVIYKGLGIPGTVSIVHDNNFRTTGLSMPLNPVYKHCYEYPRPSVTVDLVVFARRTHSTKKLKTPDPSLFVLLVKRGKDPFKDCWAIPGGFLNEDESTVQAAKRELKEETGFDLDSIQSHDGLRYVKLIDVYSNPDRDPRGRVITTAYLAELYFLPEVKGDDDAVEAKWFDIYSVLGLEDCEQTVKLAFDHHKIIMDAFNAREN